MTSMLVAIIVLLTVSSQVQSLDLLRTLTSCGKNEVFGGSSACVETCTTKPQVCPLIYKIGCVCAEGYVRQSDAEGSPCVKREDCQLSSGDTQTCGENEEYSTCGTACPATCDDLRYPLPKPPKACIALCRSGCFCKAGYYLSDAGKCVPPEQCCGANERYTTCGSACVETCDGKPEFCTKQCVIGCFCGCSDYVRKSNSTGSACIHRDDCSAKCTDDE